MKNKIKKILFLIHFFFIKKYIKYQKCFFLNNFKLINPFPESNRIYVEIGNNTTLDCCIFFEAPKRGKVIIHSNTFIGQSTLLSINKIEIEEYVFIAGDCVIYDHNSHSIDYSERINDIHAQINNLETNRYFTTDKNWDIVISKPILIKKYAWIGMKCIILKGVTIGEGAVVAAGSVVVKDVPAWTVVGGNPAQIIKYIPQELINKKNTT